MSAEVARLPRRSLQERGLGCVLPVVEAHMDVLLLNVMGSAAVASAVVAAVMANRLSKALAGLQPEYRPAGRHRARLS